MRMVYEEYYDTPKAMPLPRVPATKRKPTVTYASAVPTSAFGGYGTKTAGSSVGLPSVLAAKAVRRSSVARPSGAIARYGGGDEAMQIGNSASWESSAEQRRYRKG